MKHSIYSPADTGKKTVLLDVSQELDIRLGDVTAIFQIIAADRKENGCEPITVDANKCNLIFNNIFISYIIGSNRLFTSTLS